MVTWYSYHAQKGMYCSGMTSGSRVDVETSAKETARAWGIPVAVYEQHLYHDRELFTVWEPSHADH